VGASVWTLPGHVVDHRAMRPSPVVPIPSLVGERQLMSANPSRFIIVRPHGWPTFGPKGSIRAAIFRTRAKYSC
jgi:hypothetical protein